jgi:formamidopyrimidine-DNA glycosylase
VPELPEVETYAKYFAKHALHQRIARVDVRDERILADIRKETFTSTLKGRQFTETRRHGKHLFSRAAGKPGTRAAKPTWLHLHFGITGDLAYYRAPEPAPRFAKIVFELEGGGRLAFEDMRLFGLANLVGDPDAFIRERGLGPDPLDLDYRSFAALFEKRRGAIKSLLMSQEIIAGLGNLYVDEILFQTGVHPRRPVDRLDDAERRALFTNMRRILRTAIERDLPARSLFHHREEGERCPRCGGTLRRSVVFGRTTYFCAKHQR